MRINICGALSIESGSTVIDEHDLPGRQGRRLWAYIVLNRRRQVGRDELSGALWGEEIPDAWDASLNAVVSRVRAALDPLPDVELRGMTGRYELRLPADAVIDRERAWDAIHHVQAIRRRGDLRSAWTEAVIAHEIAARDFLPGESGAWIEAERRQLRGVALQALEAVVEADLEQQRPGEAERAARTLIGLDPLRESGYRLLMRALADGGNGGGVGAVLEECHAALASAGTEPSDETKRVAREAARRGRS